MNKNTRNENMVRFFSAPEEQAFFKFIRKVENCDQWITAPLSTFLLKESNSKLTLDVEGKSYPVSVKAIPSIKRRARNNAEIFNSLPTKEKALMLNMSWPHLSGESNILIRNGEVIATHSDRYVPIKQSAVFKSFKEKLKENFRTLTFKNATYMYYSTSCIYEVECNDLLANLKAALHNKGYKTDNNFTVYIECITSDTGSSAIMVSPGINTEGHGNYITNPVSIEHRDVITFEDVLNKFDSIPTTVHKGIENLERLLEIDINSPSAVLRTLSADKKYQIPKRLVKGIELQLLNKKKSHQITAYDFFLTLCGIFEMSDFNALTDKRQRRIREAVARVALFSEEQFAKMESVAC